MITKIGGQNKQPEERADRTNREKNRWTEYVSDEGNNWTEKVIRGLWE
jgi:hypothetical protein